MKGKKGHKAKWLVLAAILLSGCSGDDSPNHANNNNGKDSEIRLNADIWQVMEGTRATTYEAGAVNGSFKVYAYYNTTTDCYINGEVVNYSEGVSSWDGTPQRWPQNNNSLDFFAYMPTNLTGTCYTFDSTPYDAETNLDGYSAGNPRIVCTNLPMTKSGQDDLQEFVYALTQNQDRERQGESGVVMTFKRPFARIYLRWSSANHSSITLNWVKLKSLKNNGSFLFNGTTTTCTPSGDATDFTSTVFDAYDAASPVPYIMIPQEWTGGIEVNITWDNWDESVTETLSTTMPTVNWQPGYSYTYTFTISKYALIVDVNKFTEQW